LEQTKDKNTMGKIRFEHEHLGGYSGQNNYELGLYEDDNVIGYVQYVIYEDELTVSDIVVRPDRRREGFGSMLIKKMKQLHPEAQYQPSMKTDLGAKFIHKDVEVQENDNQNLELNEQIKRIRVMMGLNENLITEKLTDVDDDVDFIYDTYFKRDIDFINKTGYIAEAMFKESVTDSSVLTSELSVKAHELSPVVITINKKYGHSVSNFYNFVENLIALSINKDAVEFAMDYGGDVEKAASVVASTDPNTKANFRQEFNEERIKGSIHHELVHWIHNTLNKGAVKTSMGKFKDTVLKDRQKQLRAGNAYEAPMANINFDYIERQAQIHNIKQLYRKYKDEWDELTFNDILKLSPPLNRIYKTLPPNLITQWIRLTKQRMHREGLLGKKMYNN
jgi:GNAT superfamily N-acetyltransferase